MKEPLSSGRQHRLISALAKNAGHVPHNTLKAENDPVAEPVSKSEKSTPTKSKKAKP